jgi:hypothetical protein
MTVNRDECVFEVFYEPLGPEYGTAAGHMFPGVRATHIPTGTTADSNNCPFEYQNRRHALNKLTNLLASSEQSALVEVISRSNANAFFEDCESRIDNDTDHEVAARILRGLTNTGWKLVKDESADTLPTQLRVAARDTRHLSEFLDKCLEDGVLFMTGFDLDYLADQFDTAADNLFG